jgi:hypothetical protein
LIAPVACTAGLREQRDGRGHTPGEGNRAQPVASALGLDEPRSHEPQEPEEEERPDHVEERADEDRVLFRLEKEERLSGRSIGLGLVRRPLKHEHAGDPEGDRRDPVERREPLLPASEAHAPILAQDRHSRVGLFSAQ